MDVSEIISSSCANVHSMFVGALSPIKTIHLFIMAWITLPTKYGDSVIPTVYFLWHEPFYQLNMETQQSMLFIYCGMNHLTNQTWRFSNRSRIFACNRHTCMEIYINYLYFIMHELPYQIYSSVGQSGLCHFFSRYGFIKDIQQLPLLLFQFVF